MPLATSIFRQFGRIKGLARPGHRRNRLWVTWVLAVFWCGAGAITLLAGGLDPRQHALEQLRAAETKHAEQPREPEGAWRFAQATFDLAEFATNHHERAELAQQGIAACRAALPGASTNAPLHYYLGMNLGQLARTKSLGALKIVPEMEREFIQAQALDEHFDFAGPDRNLGLLYCEAPTIGSVGSRSKARLHLRQAARVAPEYPENRLNLIETMWKWGDRREARSEMAALEAAWDRARETFSGPQWAPNWADWKKRREKMAHKIEDAAKPIEPAHPVP